ncbi:MAG: iron-containing alcohol dehydrogenase, partial [Dermatophilaceae bacterium]|nr:iron-containing alcohol dehydrogenase [Dermatophilaceae bacterium]
PERHLAAARLLDPDGAAAHAGRSSEARDVLPGVLVDLMRDIGMPNGLSAVGYGEADVPDLVEGSLRQQRLLATAPREVDADALAGVLSRSLQLWD